MKITKSQVLQIIKEEAQKVKQEVILRRELAAIEQELNDLNEVHPGGAMDPGKDGVHAGQRKPVFTKKGTHLVEDEDEMMSTDDDMDSTMDVSSEDGVESGMDDVDIELDTDTEEMGEEGTISLEDVKAAIESLGADLGLSGQVDFDAAAAGEGDESLGVDIEMGADDMGGEDMSADIEGEMSSEEPGEEMGEEPSEEAGEEAGEESIDECGDNMDEKAVDKQRMNEEVARWKKLAGIIKG